MPRLVPSPNARNLGDRRADYREARQPKVQGQRFDGRSTYETFVARILASPVSVGTNRWRYAWEEVVVKDDHGIATPTAKRASRSTGTAAEFKIGRAHV